MEQRETRSYPPGYKPMTKEEFVRRMLSDSHKKNLELREKERAKTRVLNEYISDNIIRYKHKMHRRCRIKT